MDEVGRLTRAAGVVGFFTLLSRIVGLLRDIVIGYLFGAQGAADAFFVAFRIPNLLRRVTAEGALTAGFIPVFTDYLTHKGKDEALRVARIVLAFAILVLGALTLLGVVFAMPLTRLFAPGFFGDEEKFRLTVFLTRLMFPYIFFVSLVALAMGVLNSFRHFMAPALSPVLLNVMIISCAVLFSPFLKEPVVSLALGVLLGGVAQLLLQLPYLSRNGFRFALDFEFFHPALKRLLYLMGPTFFGAAIYQVNVLASTILASLLPQGSVSFLYYADRLLEFPIGIFAIALGTAALPSFSSLAAKKQYGELKEGLFYALRLVNFISLPATLGLIVLAVPILSIFFQRGAFGAETTVKTAEALIYFSLGLWAISGSKLVVPVFYAMQDTKTPVWIGVITFVLNFILSLVLMGRLDAAQASGPLSRAIVALSQYLSLFSLSHGGLALATSISSTFNFLVLLSILRFRLGPSPLPEFFASFLRNLLSALLMGLPLLLIIREIDWVGPGRDLLYQGGVLVFLLALGVILYLCLSLILRSPEWHLVGGLVYKIRGRS